METNKKTLIKGGFIITLILLIFGACNKEEELSDSIIKIPLESTSELDAWIDSTFRIPYNIQAEYKWNSSDIDQSKDVVPPKEQLVKPFLKTVLKMWVNPYSSVADMGNEFMKNYACRKLKLIGSGSYNNGSVTLGLAENGYKITLYTVNNFDLEAGVKRNDLRQFFRVMHHEFGHILNQRKAYDENFQNITGAYSADWTTINDAQARELGFISAYARSADTEDFVEVLSFYITYSEEEWNDILNSISSKDGANYITQKAQVVAAYMNDTYGVKIDDLRAAFLTALDEVIAGNLD